MEEELVLIKPSMEYEKQAINLIEEVEEVDTDEKYDMQDLAACKNIKKITMQNGLNI